MGSRRWPRQKMISMSWWIHLLMVVEVESLPGHPGLFNTVGLCYQNEPATTRSFHTWSWSRTLELIQNCGWNGLSATRIGVAQRAVDWENFYLSSITNPWVVDQLWLVESTMMPRQIAALGNQFIQGVLSSSVQLHLMREKPFNKSWCSTGSSYPTWKCRGCTLEASPEGRAKSQRAQWYKAGRTPLRPMLWLDEGLSNRDCFKLKTSFTQSCDTYRKKLLIGLASSCWDGIGGAHQMQLP